MYVLIFSALLIFITILILTTCIAKEFDVDVLSDHLRSTFIYHYFTTGQLFVADINGSLLSFCILAMHTAASDKLSKSGLHVASSSNESKTASGIKAHKCEGIGYLLDETLISIELVPQSKLILTGNIANTVAARIFKPNFQVSSLGIGGMDKQFENIFRRAFTPRLAPPSVIARLGIKPVKGILLFGPPGTGKTLMARQIGTMLNGREPIVVNGPEILDKFVGESEKKVRELFAPAELEWLTRGAQSDLHVIILDELDAICKQRGRGNSGGTGVGDTVVNQFLAKMDGYKEQNNILIIGMTNRKELIDEALLRPGRLEVHIEIGLPDKDGRVQILNIHTATMAKSGILDDDVSIEEIASLTKNYSGAELMGLVQNASTFSLNRHIDATNPTNPVDLESIKVTLSDFKLAISQCVPSFGVAEQDLRKSIPNGIWEYSERFSNVVKKCQSFINHVKTSSRTSLVSILMEGDAGCGKTALSASLALSSGFPHVHIVSPDRYVGFSEGNMLLAINEVFENAYRSDLSIIILDDLERLIEYVPIGPRFSNTILQGLLILVKRSPPPGRKLLIIGTTSQSQVLIDLGVQQLFKQINIPSVRCNDEMEKVLTISGLATSQDVIRAIRAKVMLSEFIPIKDLIMIAEMEV